MTTKIVEDKKFAMLIDADNISSKYIKYILDEISNYGTATYKRIYADWTTPNTTAWKEVLLSNSVTPIQQYNYTVGKNATDSAMIIDAMDILYSNYVNGFCIVSSDSDFTRLAARLRESGMVVVGMGERKTPKPFIAACNQFKYLDVLAETDNKQERSITPLSAEHSNESDNEITANEKNMTPKSTIRATITKIINDVENEDQGVNIGELGSRLVKRYPDFDVRNYGHTKLSKFIKSFGDFEVKTTDPNRTDMRAYLNPKKNPSK
jgi:uncharacterized LabA/DUF88 family protein